ncbi:hypothetical protein CQ056_24025 [Peribacillus simplex]|uniref:hypothetical protein n=1 Tax=Peribacillus TaxID=2675229 RepID=UPI000D00360D|nr:MULTISPECIES: hypothetical protein [Peribacillus]MCF7625461.1 hypothetical protein [Peribacillus frigoritolerans]PRA78495.1 hypothetical protein CQ056_24025 [Peribacillus simplex]
MFGKKKVQETEKTVQDLIPIRNIYNEMIETKDNRLIKVLSVSPVNISLMSHNEEREVLESYESFLNTIDAPIMISRVSTPVNLKDYVVDLQSQLKKMDNPYKKKILQSYIWYANNIQKDREMIRRNRYIVIDQSFSDEKSKIEAIRKLRTRIEDYTIKIEEMLRSPKLEVKELSNKELEKYIHMFFDYENAQILAIEDEVNPAYVIGRRNLINTVDRLKAEENYYVR